MENMSKGVEHNSTSFSVQKTIQQTQKQFKCEHKDQLSRLALVTADAA